jgi:hypothetical protein
MDSEATQMMASEEIDNSRNKINLYMFIGLGQSVFIQVRYYIHALSCTITFIIPLIYLTLNYPGMTFRHALGPFIAFIQNNLLCNTSTTLFLEPFFLLPTAGMLSCLQTCRIGHLLSRTLCTAAPWSSAWARGILLLPCRS